MSEKPHPEAVAVAMELFPVTPLEFDRDNGKSAIAEQEEAAKLISAAMDKAVARETETTRKAAFMKESFTGEFRIICSDLEKSELKVKALTAALQKTRKYMENFAPLEELRQVVEALEVKSAR